MRAVWPRPVRVTATEVAILHSRRGTVGPPQPAGSASSMAGFSLGAQKDFDNHRRWDPKNRDEYRNPHLPPEQREAYRDGFRRGYERGEAHLTGQDQQPPPGFGRRFAAADLRKGSTARCTTWTIVGSRILTIATSTVIRITFRTSCRMRTGMDSGWAMSEEWRR